MLLVAKERDTFLERLYELRPIARGLSPEGHCNFLMSDELPHETENTVYRYLIAISKLRLGIISYFTTDPMLVSHAAGLSLGL